MAPDLTSVKAPLPGAESTRQQMLAQRGRDLPLTQACLGLQSQHLTNLLQTPPAFRWRKRSQAAIGNSNRPWQCCCQPSR